MLACQTDEVLSAAQGHDFGGGVGEGRDGVDDVLVDLVPWSWGFKFLAVSSRLAGNKKPI